tara:strand:- start:1234 stop:1752 length:519 start_codon:yes stop_codon:yes gene_type:complete
MNFTEEQEKQLNIQKNIKKLTEREERYMYFGIYETYKAQKDLIQKLDYTKLNPRQHFLFKRVLHGVNIYKPEERQDMHWDKRRRIKKVWIKGQNTINEWKQEISNRKVNYYLSSVFGENSDIISGIINTPATETMKEYRNTLTLKDLSITYEDLILKFIGVGLLPQNYLSLK